MSTICAMNDEICVTFKKPTLRTFLVESQIQDALDIVSFGSDIEATLAFNFARFMARTDTVTLNTDSPSDRAKEWVKFWDFTRGKTNWNSLFEAYIDSLDLDHNNAWLEAFQAHEASKPAKIDPELGSPSTLPDSVLNDPEVQKKDDTSESTSEPK